METSFDSIGAGNSAGSSWWSGHHVYRFLAAAGALLAFGQAAARASVYAFAPLAGNAVVLDHTDGTGSNARFFNPTSAAVDSAGNVYIADGGDHTIRKVSPGGTVTTLAGSSGQAGSADGTGSGALFLYPYAVAVDASGNVYVADSGNNNIREVSPGGSTRTLAGAAGAAGNVDGSGTSALFNLPQGIAVDSSGNVYVSDTNNSTIRKVTPSGVVTTIAGAAGQTGGSDGTGSSARFNYPFGIATDASGNIYVADFGNSTIRKVTPGGTVSTLAGSAGNAGANDGGGSGARFNHPSAVSLDSAGNIYVADTSNQTIREVSPSGNVTTLAGMSGVGGTSDGGGASARFFYPGGIAATGSGTLFVADTGNHIVRQVNGTSVTTFAGAVGGQGSSDGTGASAAFEYPYGLAADGSGNIYIADHGNNTIRKMTSSGSVSTFAGTAGPAGSADGTGGAAGFSGPAGVAVDGSGNVYVADAGNNTIRKISPGGAVTTFAGSSGSAGSSDGTGGAARFNAPEGVAVDSVGNIYVADTENDTVRKITAGGTVTTLAGAAGQTGTGDGPGGSARFNGPYALAVDAGGNVYVADFFNASIRKIDTSGNVTTIAGSPGRTGFTDGTGSVAQFNQPYGLAVDASGNIYVADTYNRAIRVISTGGSVTTLNGQEARFFYPQGITVDHSGNIYVADGDNQDVSAGAAIAAPSSGLTIASESVATGGNTSFTVNATGPGMTYQWQTSTDSGTTWSSVANGTMFSGATTATLSISSPTLGMSGNLFRVELSNAAGSSTSADGTLTVTGAPVNIGPPTGSARIINLSVRTYVGTGASDVTVGFVISGSGSKQVLVRADGPALTAFGVGGVLSNPQLTLFNASNATVDANTSWGGGATLSSIFAAVGAFALQPTSADSAVFDTLPSGAYTAQVAGVNGSTGIALAELYDADGGDPSTRLVNVSARAYDGTGSAVLTAGFVIGGSGSETLLIRGIGPTLAQYGVTGVLANPAVTVFDSTGATVGANTVWGGDATLASAFAQVGAFALPATSADSALLITLPAGAYTVQVAGTNNSTGIALVEIYEMQ
jgi:sugar lactone lactonase YvrE